MDFERTALHGVGVTYTFQAESGQRLGVVLHASGRHDIVAYDPADVDTVLHTITLNAEEANAVGDLLGATAFIDHMPELEQPVRGLHVLRIPVRAGSPYADRPLGEARARIHDGTAIVAVLRDERSLPAPANDVVLRPGDVAVAVGDDAGTIGVKDLLLGEE